MNKFWNTAILLLAAATVTAQDLAYKIPHDAFAVVNVQTDHFFKLMSVEDFNQSTIGKVLLEKAGEAGLSDIGGIEDFGIGLNKTGYFYTIKTDSVVYYNFLLPLANAQLFEKHFGKDEEITQNAGFRGFTKDVSGSSAMFAWNEQMLSISTAGLVGHYFEQPEVAARYGIQNYSYSDYYENNDTEVVEKAEDIADSAYSDDILIAPPLPDSLAIIDTVTTDYTEEWNWEADTTVSDAAEAYDYDSNYEDDNPYSDYYEADQLIKKGLEAEWAMQYTVGLFGNNPEKNILSNSSYLKSLHKDAIVTAWLSNLETIYSSLLPELFGLGRTGKIFSHYGSINAGLFADKEGFRLSSSMTVSNELAASLKRIYKRKLNKKFLKYMNSDDMVGFFAYAVDAQSYLEELPGLIKDTYGGLVGMYEPEIALGTDIISLLLDEKAIANAVKGDALFVLNGISEEEVSYTAYEYDEDYNYQEVEKTKTEAIPDFLLMFSSDDVSIYNRIMSYTSSKGLVDEEQGVYTVQEHDMPFALHITRKDGIVFIGTSSSQLHDINANRYRGYLAKEHRNLLRKNKFSGLLSAKKIVDDIPQEQLQSLDRYIGFNKLFGSMGNFYFQSKGIKSNTISSDFVAETPEGFDNAIQYIFALMDYAAEQ
ncbi:hypothetical protein [Parapedobacter tibetensis]|uniref:hypothetical protein n=1 Tax=Parapedobacter tibetensis TaxID=2972951 RepID=UPI00214DE0E8|nr:hypothetical protein [Parapedobacter tibetensis]